MTANPLPRARVNFVIGAGLGCAGLYFLLVGIGTLPTPGGPDNLHAPLWVVACVGVAFLLSGVAIVIQGLGRGDAQGELAADAPPWLRVVQDLVGAAVVAMLALIGSWVALAGDSRQFSSNGVPLKGTSGVTLARVVFGGGALICWGIVIAMLVRAARSPGGRNRSPGGRRRS